MAIVCSVLGQRPIHVRGDLFCREDREEAVVARELFRCVVIHSDGTTHKYG